MWRPENWDTDKQKHLERADGFYPKVAICDDGSSESECRQMFEAGADAMLEAIWKLAEESPTKTFTFDKNHFHVYREE